MRVSYKLFLSGFFVLQLVSCANLLHVFADQDGAPPHEVDVSNIADAVPKLEKLSRYGNPHAYEVFGQRYQVLRSSKAFRQRGIASWYGTKFHAKRTSSGEPYDMLGMTAAHKILPLPTYVRVTNLENRKQIIVKVNDRGPFHDNRIIDLSYAAAKKLGMTKKGTALVEIDAIDPRHPEQTPQAEIPHIKPEMYLQIGAFRHRENAERLLAEIKHLTLMPVRLSSVADHQAPVYRVQLGPLHNIDSTDDLFQKLKHAQLGEAMTVVE